MAYTSEFVERVLSRGKKNEEYTSEFVERVLSQKDKNNQEYTSAFVNRVLNGTFDSSSKKQNKKSISSRKNSDISTVSLKTLQNKFKEEDDKLTNINKNIINTRNTLTKNALKEKGITSVLPTKEEVKKANQTPIFPGTTAKETLEKKKTLDAVSRANEVRKTQNEVSKSKEVQQLNKEHSQQESNTAWAEYDLNRKLINDKEVTNYDKSIGRIGDAILSNFTQFGHDYQALDEEGNEVYLDDKYQMWDKKVSESYDTKVGKFLGDVVYQGSKIASSTALNAIIPGFGSGLYWTSMYSNSYDNAKSEGYDDVNANLYAVLSTVSEYAVGKWLGSATKKLTGGKTSQLSNAIKKGISKFIKNNKVSNFLANAGSEATEEFLQEYIDVLNRQITLEKDVDIEKLLTDGETFKNALYSAGIGAVTGGTLGGDASTEGNQVNNSNSVKLPGINTQNSITLPGTQNNSQKALNTLQSKSATSPNFAQNSQIFTYQPTGNRKVDTFLQSAVDSSFNNSVETQNLLNTYSKTIQDKNYDVVFDNTITNDKGQSVDALVTTNNNGEVVIKVNPNSNRAGEFLLTHEISHAIKTQEMIDEVNKFASQNQEFANVITTIQEQYGKDLTSEEVFADVCGQLFGNQEFINSLTTQNTTQSKNMIKRIYESIVKVLNSFTEEGRYKNFVKDLESKWKEAYKNSTTEQAVSNLSNGISYHISNNALRDINSLISGTYDTSQDIKLRDYTPKELVNAGIKDLPMLMNSSHILDNILNINDAKNMGIYKPNTNYHGLGVKNYLEIIDSLDYPLAIYQWNNKTGKKYTNKDYVILTNKTINGENVIVPVYVETKGNYNYARLDTNKIKTVYGNTNIFQTLENRVKNGEMNKIFDKQKTNIATTVNTAVTGNSFSTNNIPQNGNNVKLPSTKYSMQENANNTQWQEYLEENFPSTGTRTNFKDIKLPTKKDIDNINKPNLPMNNTQNSIETEVDTEASTENKTAQLLDKRPSTEKPTLKESYYKTIRQIVDKGEAISRLSKKTGNKELYAKYDHMGTADAEGQYAVAIAQTDNHGNKIGKSVVEIWKPVEDAGLVEEFSNYLLHKHNIARWEQGKPVFGDEVTSDISRQFVKDSESTYPQFKEWSQDINTYNRNQMQNMVDAGLTSKESQEYLNNTYDNYVKIYRDIKGNSPITQFKGNLKVNVPIKKAKGGNQDILPLKDSMAQQTIEIKKAIRRNTFGLELLNVLYNGENVEYDGKQTIVKNDDGTYSFTVFKDGQPIKMEIDEGIYNALEPSKKHQFEETLPFKAIQKVSSIQRGLLTDKNPLFIATNFFKDIGDAPFNSKYASKFAKNYVVAANEIRKNGDLWNRYKALGGEQNTYFDFEKGVKLPSNKKISKFVRKISNANKIIEQLPRFTEFISTLEAGGTEAEAMYNAAEITTNFKRGGDMAKALNRNGANFLNASIQGFDKQIRNFTGQNGAKGYINLLAKATIFGVVPSVFNHMLLADDDDYEDLPDYVKDSYYLFKTDNDEFIRIPKGRVVSIFGMAARRTLEYTNGEKDAFDGMFNQIANQVAPNNPLSDNIFAPLYHVSTNTAWHGGDIVPQRLQNELPENQYDESTDAISKYVGKIFGVSPKKVNYVLDQYTGGIGDILLPMLSPEAYENSLSAKFTVNSVMSNKNVSDFYSKKEDLQKISNSTTATEEDIIKSKYFNSVNSEMNELYKEKREIQNSSLNNKEKLKEVKRIQTQINELAKEALNSYEDVSTYKNYAKVADAEYFLNTKNEWEKLSEEEIEEVNSLNLSGSEKSNYFGIKTKISKTKSNKAISSEQKHTDIANALINSNLNDDSLINLYSKHYSSEDTLNNLKDLGIPIKQFIKLNSLNIESDYNSYTGKTISGSKKNKYIQEVNNLNLSIAQKAILIKMQYTTFDDYDTAIAQYVNNLNTSLEEKKVLLKTIGFDDYSKDVAEYINSLKISIEEKERRLKSLGFTVRNGRVYW